MDVQQAGSSRDPPRQLRRLWPGGTIHANCDLQILHSLFIIAEHDFRVRHSLLALPGTKKEDLKKIISHPQALAQCDSYIARAGIEKARIARRVPRASARAAFEHALSARCLGYHASCYIPFRAGGARTPRRVGGIGGTPSATARKISAAAEVQSLGQLHMAQRLDRWQKILSAYQRCGRME